MRVVQGSAANLLAARAHELRRLLVQIALHELATPAERYSHATLHAGPRRQSLNPKRRTPFAILIVAVAAHAHHVGSQRPHTLLHLRSTHLAIEAGSCLEGTESQIEHRGAPSILAVALDLA
eukprot:1167129-Prymnesium_polylepis.1